MKRLPTLLVATMLIGSLFSSCNQSPDGDDDDMTLPDLTVTIDVSGAVTANYTFTNPENGGSSATHSMIAGHANANSMFTITGLNTAYTYAVAASMPGVQVGNFSVSTANYGHLESQPALGFPEVVSGNISITNSQVLWTAGITTIYSIDGTWSVELSDGETPPSTVTFSGTFSNLAVTSS